MKMVADENQLELSGLLDSAGVVGTKIPAQESKCVYRVWQTVGVLGVRNIMILHEPIIAYIFVFV